MADGTEKIDLSLDDIIKINKKKAGGSNKFRTNTTNNNSKAARSKIRPKIPQQQQRQKQQPQRLQQQAPKDQGATLLHVSNLDFGVSNTDLKELFEEIGPIKKASIHYDKSGRSLGTAEVVFWKRDNAVRAIKEYNNRVLDGRPMSIAMVPSRTPNKPMGLNKGSGIQKRSPQKVGGGGGRMRNQPTQNKSPRKGGNPINKGGRKGKPGNTRQPKKEVSAQELDDDLEAYLNKNQMNVD